MSQKRLLSGHTVEPMSEEEWEEIMASGVIFPGPMVRLQPDGWLLPETMPQKYLDKIYTMKVRSFFLGRCGCGLCARV